MDWQNLAALTVVGCAALYIVRRAWLAWSTRHGAACGTGCSTCPAQEQPEAKPLIGIDRLTESARHVSNSV